MADPPADRIVVLHRTVPASGAPDPRDRQVLRRVLQLAGAATTEVVLVAAEPQLGTASPELDDAGVRRVEAAGHLHDVLAGEARGGAFVFATETWLGAVALRAAPDCRLVLDLHHLGSTALERSGADATPWYLDGFDHLLDAARAHDTAVLRGAALTICADDAVADAVRSLDPGAPIVLVAPLVAVAAPAPVLADRRGVLFVGAFASAPGAPDEQALDRVLSSAVAPVAAVGVDVSLVRRALASRLRSVYAPGELDRAVRAARVVVTARGDSAETAELRAGGVPVVALDERDAHDRIRKLLNDDAGWRAAADAQLGTAIERSQPGNDAGRAGVIESLAALGAPVDPHRPPQSPATLPHRRLPALGGTLAAVTVAGERARVSTQPPPLLPWPQARFANLDLRPPEAHRRWLAVHHDVEARRDVLAARARRLVDGPLISVIMPVHDTKPQMLRAALRSVTEQIYPRWQLCIADDGSTRADTRAVLAELVGSSAQILVTRLDDAGGIASATNAALAMATGGYVAFLDHDDVLTPDALLLVAERIVAEPDLDVLYSDEDKLDRFGRRTEPFFKPDWSPDLLLSCNYLTHLLVARRSLVAAVGGVRAGFEGAQDYDLVLRLTEQTDRVGHVAAPLYSWRMSATSTAADIANKPGAHDASRRALQDALVRREIEGSVEPAFDPTWHRVRRTIRHRPLVTVVIPTRDRLDLLAPCIDRLSATVDHEPIEILVVDNDSRDPATLDYLTGFDGQRGRVVRYPHRFNYARQMNLAAREARGEVLLLLNNDVRPLDDGWFDAMLEHALRREVGAVGARLRFPSGRIQHEGIVLNACAFAANLDSGPWSVLGENIRNVSAVTAACVMVRTAVWHEVGGMEERLGVAWNDVDLCLRIGERGWRVIYTPYACLEHAEGSSRGSGHPPPDDEFYERRWGPERSTADPFFTTAVETLVPYSPRV